MRSVVITGIGLVTPLANGCEASWQKLIDGRSGVRPVTGFDVSDLPSRIAAQIPIASDEAGCADPDALDLGAVVSALQRRRMGTYSVYAIAAAEEALSDAGWRPGTDEEKSRTGVMIGSAIGGIHECIEGSRTLEEHGVRRVSPFFVPRILSNMASGNVAIRFEARGPNGCAVTACASGGHSIGDAARAIALDDADVMIAGGTEAALCRMTMAGFAACRALSTGFNDRPEAASRPFDNRRDGFVIGEGAGVMVLEEESRARARGANIHARLVGYGMSCDATHITAPPANGAGVEQAMTLALKSARIAPEELDYVNAHGTSTPIGDEGELRAIERIFAGGSKQPCISSTKSSVGHLLGASGAVELAFAALAMRDSVIPPSLNLDDPIDTPLDLVPHRAKERVVHYAMSNSFGFGGTNSCLILKAVR